MNIKGKKVNWKKIIFGERPSDELLLVNFNRYINFVLLLFIGYICITVFTVSTETKSISWSLTGDRLKYVFHGSSYGMWDAIVSKTLISLLTLIKFSAFLFCVICAKRFFKSIGGKFIKFNKESARQLRFVAQSLFVIFYSEVVYLFLFLAFRDFSGDGVQWSWLKFEGEYMNKFDLYITLYFFGYSILLISKLVARGVELEEEAEATI